MPQEDEDDATEILAQDDETVYRADPLDTVTEVHDDSTTATATATTLIPAQQKKRQLSWRIIAGLLSLLLVSALGYYIFNQPPPATNTVQSRIDLYPEALTMAESAIAQGEVDTLPALLLRQSRRQPGNAQVQALLQDATHYRDMLYLLHKQHLLDLAESRRRHTFHSALFEQAAQHYLDPGLGAPAILQHLSQARDAWQAGELVKAITLVNQQTNEAGGQQAKAMLRHYSRVVEDYETLSTQKTDPGYLQVLLSFYLGLDPWEDRFFWRRLEGDFKQVQDPLAAGRSKQLQRVGQLWSSYRSQGGIDGPMRQDASAANTFPQRAKELTEADSLLREMASSLQSLEQSGEQARLLPTTIDKEIQVQRERLQALRRFNDEAILSSRLLMLAPADTASQ